MVIISFLFHILAPLPHSHLSPCKSARMHSNACFQGAASWNIWKLQAIIIIIYNNIIITTHHDHAPNTTALTPPHNKPLPSSIIIIIITIEWPLLSNFFPSFLPSCFMFQASNYILSISFHKPWFDRLSYTITMLVPLSLSQHFTLLYSSPPPL